MKYCVYCGNKLNLGDSFCSVCGRKIENEPVKVEETKSGMKTASIVLGILSLVGVSFVIFAPLAFIEGIIGLILGIKANKKVKNTAGIVLNAIGLFLSTIILLVGLFFANIIIAMYKSGEFDYIMNDEPSADDLNDFFDNYGIDSEDF